MSHVELRKRDLRKNNVRRKSIEGNFGFQKMVGLGSEELLGSDIADIAMELEINSDDESEESDKQRLIRSSITNEAVNNHIKKLTTQKVQVTTEDDNVWSISIQMFIPFLLAGFGMVAASLLLDVVQVCKQSRIININID